MYSPQEIADKIKQLAKNKGVSLKQMLSDCELGINFVSQIASGSAITYINLAKIADYFDVSVDYLLGRENTSNTALHYSGNNNITDIINDLLTLDISEGDTAVIRAILNKYK